MSDEHIKRKYIVEDKWKCSTCGELNPGRFLKCQKCGTAKQKRDEDVTDLESAEVSDEKLLQMAGQGANWVCAYCGAQDRTADGRCRNCGAKQEEAKAGEALGSKSQGEEQAPPVAPPPPKKSSHVGLYVVLGLLGSCGAGIVVCLAPHQKAAKVASTHWVYTADLEQRQLLHGSGFSWPGDAFNKRCESRQHGTHQCEPYSCGSHDESYDCRPHDCNCHKVSHSKKNGFSEVEEVCGTCYDKCTKQVASTCYHQCPTYDQWCSYDYYQWNKVGTRKAEGESADTHWPDGVNASGADQRVTRTEKYQVGFDVDGKTYTLEPKTLDEFRKFTRGAAWTVKVNAAGSVWPEAPAR